MPEDLDPLLALRGELSRAALRYAEAWQRHCKNETRVEGELDAAWTGLEAAAQCYWLAKLPVADLAARIDAVARVMPSAAWREMVERRLHQLESEKAGHPVWGSREG